MIDAILIVCMLLFLRANKIKDVGKIAFIIIFTSIIPICLERNIIVRINIYILICMAIIDAHTHTIPNELTLYFLLVNLFIRESKLFTKITLDFNFYTCIALLAISFLISTLSTNLGFGDFKLMLASFIAFNNESFLNIFFLLSILIFIYSLTKFLLNRNLRVEIAMCPFFFITYVLLNV